MAIIDTSIGINAPIDSVWGIIPDLDNESKLIFIKEIIHVWQQ